LGYPFAFPDVPPHLFPDQRIRDRLDQGYGSSFLIVRSFPVNDLSGDQGVPAPATTAAGGVRLSFPQEKENPFPFVLEDLLLIKLVPARDASILFIEGMNKFSGHDTPLSSLLKEEGLPDECFFVSFKVFEKYKAICFILPQTRQTKIDGRICTD
jgi:hypothetical protein